MTNLMIAAFKVLLNKDTNQIIGAHLLGHHAEDIINIFEVAMNGNITGGQLKKKFFLILQMLLILFHVVVRLNLDQTIFLAVAEVERFNIMNAAFVRFINL